MPVSALDDVARDSRSRSCPRTIVLIGQPNCGKSTIFNHVVRYRSETANFPGSTVEVAQGQVRLNGCITQLMDAPGIYSLTSSNPAEAAAKQFLLGSDVDLIINVLDASLLSRSLELTLELRELGMPILALLPWLFTSTRLSRDFHGRWRAESLRHGKGTVIDTRSFKGKPWEAVIPPIMQQRSADAILFTTCDEGRNLPTQRSRTRSCCDEAGEDG